MRRALALLAALAAAAAPAAAAPGACVSVPAQDYDAGSGGPSSPAATAEACCAQCVAAGPSSCWASVFDIATGGVCWLKSKDQTTRPVYNPAVVGCWPAGRPPPPPPPPPVAPLYDVTVVSLPADPVISFLPPLANSDWPQSFNPAFVEASAGTGGKKGLLVRSQNCSGVAPGQCIACNVDAKWPIAPFFPGSVLTFAELLADGTFARPYLVFSPDGPDENYGTEDPRLAYDSSTKLYHLMYTCYSSVDGGNLCHATTPDPTMPYPGNWTRLPHVFPTRPATKSGALLIRPQGPPHFLYWGDSQIHLAVTTDLVVFTTVNESFIAPRADHFDSGLCEAGPLPMLLADGNYVFFHNSATSPGNVYHPGFVILNGSDPTQILQRSELPLLSPTRDWELGAAPAACNVPNVVFLEAVTRAPGQSGDVFDVYFGGSDAVVGTARVAVARSS
jgi:predicted GH43/DUF377 family glycosyl hydrolase